MARRANSENKNTWAIFKNFKEKHIFFLPDNNYIDDIITTN